MLREKNNNFINTMIIPAAGYGTRMHRFTCGTSKELLEAGGKPVLMYALQEADAAGLSRVCIVIRKGKEDIIEMVQDDSRMASICNKIEIRFFYQLKPNGEAGAIHVAAEWLGDAPFVVHYPDNIIAEPPGVLAELIRRQTALKTDTVLLTKILYGAQAPPCDLVPLGEELYRLSTERAITDFLYGLRTTGIYAATRNFMESCDELLQKTHTGEVKDSDVRRHMISKGTIIHAIDLSAGVMDLGNPTGYKMARAFLR